MQSTFDLVEGYINESLPPDASPEEVAQARRIAQSQIPVMLNRTDFPGPSPGRNVAFLDGHVEYVRTGTDQWNEEIAPYLP